MSPAVSAAARPKVEQLVELGVHAGEAVAAELLGVEVELEVERADLGRVRVAGERGEHRQRSGRRLPRGVDEEHLLLGADAPDAGLEAVVSEHHLQRLQVAQHPADRRLPIGSGGRRLLAHSARPTRRDSRGAWPATAASRGPSDDPTSRRGWGCRPTRSRGRRATTHRCPRWRPRRWRTRRTACAAGRGARSSRCGKHLERRRHHEVVADRPVEEAAQLERAAHADRRPEHVGQQADAGRGR